MACPHIVDDEAAAPARPSAPQAPALQQYYLRMQDGSNSGPFYGTPPRGWVAVNEVAIIHPERETVGTNLAESSFTRSRSPCGQTSTSSGALRDHISPSTPLRTMGTPQRSLLDWPAKFAQQVQLLEKVQEETKGSERWQQHFKDLLPAGGTWDFVHVCHVQLLDQPWWKGRAEDYTGIAVQLGLYDDTQVF
eukprot:TRINITY_DN3065_c0_g1_i1.p1 TRINITY_DN3065_c0_g1~~TRINITY_DN3065_c0_g1_i1.p1  ORF type:complete len:192 (+),score=36.26 TRINITY_DN3065_c0_g1_i1:57-632(+)